MSRELFGTAPDGAPVERVRIDGGGLSAWIMSWGAAVQDLRLTGHGHPLVLGFAEFADYPVHSRYFGAIAGRYANRIREGRFSIDGTVVQADRNYLGKHLLHGGENGLSQRNWTVVQADASSVVLEITDPDGEMGFPGTCRLTVTYSLRPGGVLAVRMAGETDRPTLVNLAHHSYFNLDGSPDILDHEVRINAAHYLPVDDENIPTGDIVAVEGTPFDFRKMRPVRCQEGGRQVVYDHNFCLSGVRAGLREVAWARGPGSGIAMTVATTEPGLQFYAGHGLDTPVPGLTGSRYGECAGFCMEPQLWPDSPNREEFPSPVLRPGERYLQCTEYRFVAGQA